MSVAGIDHSQIIPEWLAPVKDLEVLDLGGGYPGMNAQALRQAGIEGAWRELKFDQFIYKGNKL